MNKFPVLSFYQLASTTIATLILIAGIFGGIENSRTYNSFYGTYSNDLDIGRFSIVFIPSLILALTVAVSGEMFKLFIRIEEHLDRLRTIAERSEALQDADLKTSVESLNISPTITDRPTEAEVPEEFHPTPHPTNMQNVESIFSEYEIIPVSSTGKIVLGTVNIELLILTDAPAGDTCYDEFGQPLSLVQGKQVYLVGKSDDDEWVQLRINTQEKYWAEAEAFDIDGNLVDLRIVAKRKNSAT